MRRALFLLLSASVASGHRLDEYLQATTFSIGKERVQAQITLTPGVAVSSAVMAGIDTDRDGVITEAERHAYARRVLSDLSLSIDGDERKLQLVSVSFPKLEQMKEGLGEIQIDFTADVPGSRGSTRRLSFENRHQLAISAYLVNCLVPEDPDVQVARQQRNYQQSVYQLEYAQRGVEALPMRLAGGVALVLLARFAVLWRRRRALSSSARRRGETGHRISPMAIGKLPLPGAIGVHDPD